MRNLSAQSKLGTEIIDYTRIKWARASQTPERSVSLTGISFNISKIFGSTTTFTVGQKQYAQEVQELDNYDENIRDLRNRSVILYDTLTQRGWLLDAERATLQILLHRCKTRQGGQGIDFGLISEPLDVRSVMITNRKLKLWEDWDSTKNEKKDVFFAAEVKKIREKLLKLAIQSQSEYRRLSSSKKVVGFEYRGVVETPENLDSLMVNLDSTCGAWPRIAHRQLYATVLFGYGFQEILVPKQNAGLCLRYRRMPSNKSYLAAETETIRKLIQTMALSLISTDSLFPTCAHPNDDETRCSCVRVQAIKTGTSMNPKIYQDICSHSGAIIIGERIPKQLSLPKSTDQKPVAVSELAERASNLAQLVIPSGDGSQSRANHAKEGYGRRLGMWNIPTLRSSSFLAYFKC